jgi:hypothetical protein
LPLAAFFDFHFAISNPKSIIGMHLGLAGAKARVSRAIFGPAEAVPFLQNMRPPSGGVGRSLLREATLSTIWPIQAWRQFGRFRLADC